MCRQLLEDNKSQGDDIPQRPFRRLSGSCCSEHHRVSLPSVLEDHHEDLYNSSDDNNDVDDDDDFFFDDDVDLILKSMNCKDFPPKKPSHSGLTYYNDDSTVPTYLEDKSSIFSADEDGSLHFSIPSHQATYQQVKAREQPNAKVSTIPIDVENPKYFTLWKRKRMVKKFWSTLQERDLVAWRDLLTDDFERVSIGAEGKVIVSFNVEQVMKVAKAILDSLPDWKFMYSDNIEESCDKPGCLVVHEFVGSGTHTGQPFALGPGSKPIETTNKFIVLDETEQHFHFCSKTNKICKLEEIAMGEITGPPGIYTLLSQP